MCAYTLQFLAFLGHFHRKVGIWCYTCFLCTCLCILWYLQLSENEGFLSSPDNATNPGAAITPLCVVGGAHSCSVISYPWYSVKSYLWYSVQGTWHTKKEEGAESTLRERQLCQIKARWVLKILELAEHIHRWENAGTSRPRKGICYKFDISNPHLA